MLRVGIWIPLPRNTHWQGEGIARTIEFIVKGMIDEGLVGKDISLVIYTTHWTEESLVRSFRELLEDDFGKIEFKYLTESVLSKWQLGVAKSIADLFYAGPVLLDKKRSFFDKIDAPKSSDKGLRENDLVAYYQGTNSVTYGKPVIWPFTLRPMETNFGLARWYFNRRMARFCKQHQTTHEALISNRKEILSGANKDRALRDKARRKNTDLLMDYCEKFVSRFPLGTRVLNRFVRRAEERAFYKSILKYTQVTDDSVDVWWTPSPVVRGVELLQKPNLINFYDFFVGEYGYYWGKVQVVEIYFRLALILSRATQVITQSRFNKYEKIIHPFEVEPEQITVCNFAAPSHYNKYVPLFEKEGVKTDASLSQAAEIIRDEMTMRATATNRHDDYARVGGQNDKLTRFDFEKEKFIIISTQNRPYKNLKFIVDMIPELLEKFDEQVYFFFTAELDFQKYENDPMDREDPLVKQIFRNGLQRFVFSVPRLPNNVHAAMYHCATMTLHPSLAEGGVGSYPFMEGMTMGTPGLTGAGDHTFEGRNLHPDYDTVTYRTNDKAHAVSRIVEIMESPESAYIEQFPVYEKHRDWSWQRVGKVYRDALWSTSGRTDYTPLMLGQNKEPSPYYEGLGGHPSLAEALTVKKES